MAALQHPAHGRVLRVAARLQNAVRRPQDPSGLPAGRSRPDQRRRLRGAPAGARPQGSGGAATRASCPARSPPAARPGVNPEGLRPRRPLHAGAAVSLATACANCSTRSAKSRVPCMSIMNMPPLPYVKRIPGLDYEALKPAYTDPTVWDKFDPEDADACAAPTRRRSARRTARSTCCWSRCRPTSRCARSTTTSDTAILRQLEKDIEAVRFDTPEGKIELPVKLKVYDSIFVPLAKWSMLLAGNYRCITKDGMRTAQEAVHTQHRDSRARSTTSCSTCA